jgi:hypothetical protein
MPTQNLNSYYYKKYKVLLNSNNYFDLTLCIIYSNVNTKANSSDLENYYNKKKTFKAEFK